jgi:SH3-like domain-containing protein
MLAWSDPIPAHILIITTQGGIDMKTLRTLTAVIVVAVLILSIIPAQAFASETETVMYVTGDEVNERKSPDRSSHSYGYHYKGERVHVSSEIDGWFQLTNGHYISGLYLKTAEELDAEFVANSYEYMYVNGTYVNERRSPSTEEERECYRQPGEKVKVLSFEGNWAKIDNGNYICLDYLSHYYEDVVEKFRNDYSDIVIISITYQHAAYFRSGENDAEADVVTGSDETPTPIGLYTVTGINHDCYLMNNSFVHFFVAFNGGIGIHDAPWRSSFGGTRYHEHGSHGCVNTTYSFAEFVYNNCKTGKTQVLVLP